MTLCFSLGLLRAHRSPAPPVLFTLHTGGRYFLYPKTVWSPSGGWFHKAPENWERNTGIAFGIMFLGAFGLHRLSSSLEVSGLMCSTVLECAAPLGLYTIRLSAINR